MHHAQLVNRSTAPTRDTRAQRSAAEASPVGGAPWSDDVTATTRPTSAVGSPACSAAAGDASVVRPRRPRRASVSRLRWSTGSPGCPASTCRPRGSDVDRTRRAGSVARVHVRHGGPPRSWTRGPIGARGLARRAAEPGAGAAQERRRRRWRRHQRRSVTRPRGGHDGRAGHRDCPRRPALPTLGRRPSASLSCRATSSHGPGTRSAARPATSRARSAAARSSRPSNRRRP